MPILAATHAVTNRNGLPLQRPAIMREERGPQWDPSLLAISLDLVEHAGPLPAGY